jgi:cobaltochelatase CobT
MSAEQAEIRRQQRLQELCAATLRALTGDPSLHQRGQRWFRGGQPLAIGAPHLRVDAAHDSFDSLRGASDGLAMRLAGSDAALYRAGLPQHPVQRLVFEWLEQYRCEALAPLAGVRLNLQRRHAAWTDAFLHSRLTESVSGLLLFTLAQVARSRLTGEPLPEALEDMMEGTRMSLAPAIGTDLAGLRRSLHDQRVFAGHALAIARHIASLVDEVPAAAEERGKGRATREAQPSFALWIDPPDDGPGPGREQAGDGARAAFAGPTAYRIFSTAYDREQRADTGIRPAQLREWREQLDKRIAAQGYNLPRLARELRAVLARPATDGWDTAQEEGHIDGRRLALLVASPTELRLFRQPHQRPVADAAVSLLIDCSGSMKPHAESLAALCDTTLRALELAGAGAELLGFTTGAWNGGRARRDWQRAGQAPHSGRLNERLHLVFKDAQTPWRRARSAIAALLRTEAYREGIDGEAVDWACERLLAQDAARRILVVITDGCPMDTATQQANGPGLLDEHLREVVMRREARGEVQIVALGVGLDPSPWYRHHRVMETDGVAGHSSFSDLLALLRRQERG